MVLKQQPCSEHQQDQGGHSGLQEVQEDRARSSPHPQGKQLSVVNNIKFLGIHITSDLNLVHEHSSPAPGRLLQTSLTLMLKSNFNIMN
ncbi:hypothetical protein L3Q82_004866 [Scortum barcoo]|uniref:Uncharacterized protein n=1 Tax=Scortum barcoo TaxID=214431 RepID=A0ACB8VEJ0_9TELE|nr:hypothetical protein L3Q82_004866 [Scortum barcoo]